MHLLPRPPPVQQYTFSSCRPAPFWIFSPFHDSIGKKSTQGAGSYDGVFWYILASVLVGVGTGLVGLSAATVTVSVVNTVILLGLYL